MPGGCWNPAYLRLFYNIVPSLTSSHQTDPPLLLYSRVYFALFKTCWLPRWRSGEDSACQCRRLKRCGMDPWVGKISWRRKWQPTLVFLPEKSHEQRNLVGYRLAEGWTQLSNWTQTRTHSYTLLDTSFHKLFCIWSWLDCKFLESWNCVFFFTNTHSI